MANVTVSSDVDTMLQSANNAAIRSNIGATSVSQIESAPLTFNDEINFDSTVFFNDQTTFDSDSFFNGQAEFGDSVEFQGSTEFQDDTQFQSLVEFDSDQGVEFTGGGSIIGVSNINTVSLNASSFVKVSPITTTQRNALSAANGMIIYNSSLNKFQAYENGAWANLI